MSARRQRFSIIPAMAVTDPPLERRDLPPLTATVRLDRPAPGTDTHKAWSAVHRMTPSPDRWKERSRTYGGIARACASQWGGHVAAQLDTVEVAA